MVVFTSHWFLLLSSFFFAKHNIYMLLHACSATVRLLYSLPTRVVRSDHVVSQKNLKDWEPCRPNRTNGFRKCGKDSSVARITEGDGALPLPLTCLLGHVCKCWSIWSFQRKEIHLHITKNETTTQYVIKHASRAHIRPMSVLKFPNGEWHASRRPCGMRKFWPLSEKNLWRVPALLVKSARFNSWTRLPIF